MLLVRWLLFIVLIANAERSYAQIISNPSFEGTPQASVAPPSWNACNEWSTPDTQPGAWGVTFGASSGNSYISLTTRGSRGDINDNTVEAISTKLSGIKSNSCYSFSIDLAFSNQFSFDFIQYQPVILKVWLSANDCQKTNLVWTSPRISHTNWQTYNFTFTGNPTYNYLVMEVGYAASNSHAGNMLLDNIKLTEKTLNLGADTKICSGTSVVLKVDNTWKSITWSNGTHEASYEVSNGKHWVTVQSESCVLRDTINIDYVSPLHVELGDNLSLCEDQDTVLVATTADAVYKWNTGSTEKQIKVKDAGLYWIEVSNACEKVRDEITVFKREECCQVTMPNVFTPNGDNVNDYFKVTTESNIESYNIRILNRWGGLVYESDTIGEFWDGIRHDQESSTGVYYYTIHITCKERSNALKKDIKGFVSLLK